MSALHNGLHLQKYKKNSILNPFFLFFYEKSIKKEFI